MIFQKSYNELAIENRAKQGVLKNWLFQKYLDKTQYESALKEFPIDLHQSNIFVKIGLFIFTNIIVFAAAGLFTLLFGSSLSKTSSIVSILSVLFGVVLFFALENFIKTNKFYRSGVDNALLYCMLGSFYLFVLAITDFKLPTEIYLLIAVILLTIALIKYGDLFVSIWLYGCWMVFWFIVFGKNPTGKLLLPFVIMLLSALNYYGVILWQKKDNSNYYSDAQKIIEVLALATFYIGGNYFFVREGNAMLNNLSDSIQIDFALIFYLFTLFIPLLYIYFGLKKHDRSLLIVGLLATAFSIYTYHEYFSKLPLEWALTIGGLVLVIISILSIRLLKTPKYTLTYQPDSDNKYQNLEAKAVSQIIPLPNQPEGTKFGGGEFGGSGAGGDY